MQTPQGKETACLHHKHPKSECETILIRIENRIRTLAVGCKDVLCWIPDKTKTQYLAVFAVADADFTEPALRGFIYCAPCGKVVNGKQDFKLRFGITTRANLAKEISYGHYIAEHLPVAESSSSSESD